MSLKNFKARFFRDKDGNLVLWQWPNIALSLWLICLILAKLLPSGSLRDLTAWLGFGSLLTWAVLELFWGVDYFRRLVGLIVLAIVIHSHI